VEDQKIAEVSSRVTSFLSGHVRAVWELELLFFFKRSERPLQVQEISRALYMEAGVLQPTIARWVEEGILQSSEDRKQSFIYSPRAQSVADAIEETRQVYLQRRVTLINLIYSTLP
jgi:hypothetical protein